MAEKAADRYAAQLALRTQAATRDELAVACSTVDLIYEALTKPETVEESVWVTGRIPLDAAADHRIQICLSWAKVQHGVFTVTLGRGVKDLENQRELLRYAPRRLYAPLKEHNYTVRFGEGYPIKVAVALPGAIIESSDLDLEKAPPFAQRAAPPVKAPRPPTEAETEAAQVLVNSMFAAPSTSNKYLNKALILLLCRAYGAEKPEGCSALEAEYGSDY